jgi:hypothetical protein
MKNDTILLFYILQYMTDEVLSHEMDLGLTTLVLGIEYFEVSVARPPGVR